MVIPALIALVVAILFTIFFNNEKEKINILEKR